MLPASASQMIIMMMLMRKDYIIEFIKKEVGSYSPLYKVKLCPRSFQNVAKRRRPFGESYLYVTNPSSFAKWWLVRILNTSCSIQNLNPIWHSHQNLRLIFLRFARSHFWDVFVFLGGEWLYIFFFCGLLISVGSLVSDLVSLDGQRNKIKPFQTSISENAFPSYMIHVAC